MRSSSLSRRSFLGTASAASAVGPTAAAAQFGSDRLGAARRWAEVEFRPSTLSLDERMAEMEFFVRAASRIRERQIFVLSETIRTHEYEARVLSRAFAEITGITVIHDVAQEGEVVNRLQQQRRSGRNFYDAYVNDSDFIGTHYRYGGVTPISDWIAGDGAEVTLPTFDLDDFIGLPFVTGPDGKVYQLPDQQFAALYWFRHDWFQREDLRARFRELHGYELGVPVNWKAYEDIAAFFTEEVGELDGRRVWGHMDYGARDPSLGWRFTDAWLSIAGAADPGIPNGQPVDEWGIRVEDCIPVGASMARGGAADSPAAVYALRKYLEWLRDYAPPGAAGLTFSEAGPVPGRGDIAQQIFWYTAFTPELSQPGLPVVNPDGTPRWRVAPMPRGAYWREGMKHGYQDCGAWTMMESTPVERRKAAWLYAQFCTCRTVSLKKTMIGLTPIRASDIASEAMGEAAPELGGLVEFYRSPARRLYTPTGTNVPHYPLLAQVWWQTLSAAVHGNAAPEEVMGRIAADQDALLARLAQDPALETCPPALNEPEDPAVWLERPGAPWPALDDEEGQGETVAYEDLLAEWGEA
jgi:glycerol transport system substrate-binding protein